MGNAVKIENDNKNKKKKKNATFETSYYVSQLN